MASLGSSILSRSFICFPTPGNTRLSTKALICPISAGVREALGEDLISGRKAELPATVLRPHGLANSNRTKRRSTTSSAVAEVTAPVSNAPFDLKLAILLSCFAFDSYDAPKIPAGAWSVTEGDTTITFHSRTLAKRYFSQMLDLEGESRNEPTKPKSASSETGSASGSLSDPSALLKLDDKGVRSYFNDHKQKAMEDLCTIADILPVWPAGFQRACFVDQLESDTQVSVWIHPEQREIVVAFRGSQEKLDFLVDAALLPIPYRDDGAPTSEEIRKATVHSGFSVAYASVKAALTRIVDSICRTSDPVSASLPLWTLYVTGHSLGAGLATLFTEDMATRGPESPNYELAMYTIGSPRVGNVHFAINFNESIKNKWRVTNNTDNVPRLPTGQGFCHVDSWIHLDSESDGTAVHLPATSSEVSEHEKRHEGLVSELVYVVNEYIVGAIQSTINGVSAMLGSKDGLLHRQDSYFLAFLKESRARVIKE